MAKDSRTFGDKAADAMRHGMGTWSAFFGMIAFMGGWMIVNSVILGKNGIDPYPWILLNLMLSTLAGLQGVILLIASKRSDAVSDATLQKIANETDQIDKLIIENTELTKQIHKLVKQIQEK